MRLAPGTTFPRNRLIALRFKIIFSLKKFHAVNKSKKERRNARLHSHAFNERLAHFPVDKLADLKSFRDDKYKMTQSAKESQGLNDNFIDDCLRSSGLQDLRIKGGSLRHQT